MVEIVMKSEKKEKRTKVKIDVDFSSLGASYENTMIFNAIIQNNGNGRSKVTSSRYVLKAFNNYREDIDDETLRFLDIRNKALYLLETLNLKCEDDFYFYIRHKSVEPPAPLKEPYKRMVTIELTDEGGEELCNTLTPLKTRERSQTIYKYVKQYLILTKNEYYIEQGARRLFATISNLYQMKDVDATSNSIMQELMDEILTFSSKVPSVRKRGIETYSYERDAEQNASTIDEFNKLLGIR